MGDDHFPWSELTVQLSWSDFLENQFTKSLGFPLGVNRMWTKRNHHAPNSECVDSLNLCPQRKVLKKQIKFDHSLLIIFSSPTSSSSSSSSSLSSSQNPLDHVSG
jgi:hypothetical protein